MLIFHVNKRQRHAGGDVKIWIGGQKEQWNVRLSSYSISTVFFKSSLSGPADISIMK